MKKFVSLLLCCMMALSFACAEAPASVTGKVTEIEKYGHALLDVKIADFLAAGFTLGDVVTVTAGTYNDDMPFFDGYYVDKGAYMVRAYPGHEYIAVCINYGKFAETAGIGVGDSVTITLKEKAGALDVQVMNSLVYTDDRADYATDEVFANFRMVTAGQIGEGKLYRSASPINNEHKRAAVSNALAETAKIKTVMNLADTDDEIAAYVAAEDFNSAYYKSLYDNGSVIVLSMSIDYSSDDFAAGIIKGLNFLAGKEAPYLLHCTEGKDRAGFTSMLLSALMGATQEEIVADYMLSYVNYYGIDPVAEADKYNMIAEKNVMDMLRTVCGAKKGAALNDADIAAAAEKYLTDHGMTADAIAALKANLK
ncbi:MAG: tyrosine-protein phosphatase [Clostridia bacterium]|nr:tyrosine-protein phosphatase [Clostridia bacterium]